MSYVNFLKKRKCVLNIKQKIFFFGTILLFGLFFSIYYIAKTDKVLAGCSVSVNQVQCSGPSGVQCLNGPDWSIHTDSCSGAGVWVNRTDCSACTGGAGIDPATEAKQCSGCGAGGGGCTIQSGSCTGCEISHNCSDFNNDLFTCTHTDGCNENFGQCSGTYCTRSCSVETAQGNCTQFSGCTWNLYPVADDGTPCATSCTSTTWPNPGTCNDSCGGTHTCTPSFTASTIWGRKVSMPGNVGVQTPTSDTIANQTVIDPNTQFGASNSNPYIFSNIPPGSHTVSVTVPSGYTAGYSICTNTFPPAIQFNPNNGGNLYNGLLSYYRLDDYIPGPLIDSGPGSHTGGYGGGATTPVSSWSTKIAGSSVHFPWGAGSIAEVNTPITTNTTNWSISTWVKLDAFSESKIFAFNGDTRGGYGVGLMCDDCSCGRCGGTGSELGAYFSGIGWIDSGYQFTDTNWHNVVVTRDNSGTMRFYVDKNITTKSSNQSPGVPGRRFTMGAGYAWDNFSQRYNMAFSLLGYLDEVGVWNRALSKQEIDDIYNNGQGNVVPYSYACHNNVTSGSSATVNVPNGGVVDLWWHFSLPTPAPTAGPWWQVKDADVVTNGNLISSIPSVSNICSTPFGLNGTGGFPGVPSYQGTADFCSATGNTGIVSSPQGWLANTLTSYSKTYSYAFFKSQIPADVQPLITEITSSSVNNGYFNSNQAGQQAGRGYYWYHYDGSKYGNTLTISNINLPGTRKVILLVENAKLNITSGINFLKGSGFFMAIVNGNITIDPAVGHGGANPSNNPDIEGIFVADGNITTGTGGTQNDKALYIRGSMAALGSVTLQRNINSNQTTPAEFFEYAPDMMTLYPSIFTNRRIRWKEVAP